MTPEHAGRPASLPKTNIAKWIIVFSFAVVGTLGVASILAIAFGKPGQVDQVKDILSILLPVISAWAGTVIAYYFSRENFEAASKSTSDLAQRFLSDEKLRTIPASDVMIPIEDARVLHLKKGQNDDNIGIKADIIDPVIKKKGKNRVPVLDADGHIRYMLHRSLIDRFLVAALSERPDQSGRNMDSFTLKDLVEDPDCHAVVTNSIATLPESTTLADVKTAMEKIPGCADAFITGDGTRRTPVIGWITNIMIMEHSRP